MCPVANYGQDNSSIPERTPEQEAAKQTEKLQQELNLSAEQTRQVHEINLKYARARKISNTRVEAIQRMKDKEVELSRILNHEQQSALQNKRYERSSFQSTDNNQVNSILRPSYTQPRNIQPRSTLRSNPTDNHRSIYRNPTENRSSSVRSATPSVNTSPRSYSGQSAVRNSIPSQQSSGGGRR